MSNFLGRKSDFIPQVYTRYFERTETRKSSNEHVYFDDDNQETSTNYQIKRDRLFKRLFPSKYADPNNNQTDIEQNNLNGNINSLNNSAQSLGDFIPLSNNNNSSILKTQQSSSFTDTDIILSSSDENEEDLLIEEEYPSSTHQSIVGHLHPRATIENVRTILIRELYQRTSDSNTEWLKCKMGLPKQYINPKYYADFERRYKKNIKKKSKTKKDKTENGYVYDLTTQTYNTVDDKNIIEISSTKPVRNISPSSPILLLNDSSSQIKPIPEYIVLDSDEDNNDDNLNENTESTYFIDRSSTTSLTTTIQSVSIPKEDYQKEDSKYAQLPSRNTSSSPLIIRPILSKHQRRKQHNSTVSSKPLVSAIDRIIDHMDQSDTLTNSNTIEQQNLLINQNKKRKKKKKKKSIQSTIN